MFLTMFLSLNSDTKAVLQWLIENHPTRPSKAEWTETLVLKLTAGDFFGEIALLSGKPRQATVRAHGAVAVLVLTRDAFTRLCGNLFDILHRNMSKYSTMELPDDAQPNGAAEQEAEDEDEEDGQGEEEEAPAQAPPQLRAKQRSRRSNVFVEAGWFRDSRQHASVSESRYKVHVTEWTPIIGHRRIATTIDERGSCSDARE